MGNQVAKNDVLKMTGQCAKCAAIAVVRRMYEPILCPECLLEDTHSRGKSIDSLDPFDKNEENPDGKGDI